MRQKECTKTKDGIRIVKRDPYDEERQGMEKKMQMRESRETYKLRKENVEPVFGDIKEKKGVTGFLTGGLRMVNIEKRIIFEIKMNYQTACLQGLGSSHNTICADFRRG